MQFKRFATLTDMQAWAQAYAITCEERVWCDIGIYTDDNGLTYRPLVMLVAGERETVFLRWNAFCDEKDVSHMGPRARQEANDASDWFCDQVQHAIDAVQK